MILDDDRAGLQRLQHAADADAAGDVHVLADLRAGADRGPGVDHGRFVDIGAEIDEGRHQHDVLGDEGRAAHDRTRHGAETGVAEFLLGIILELRGHLVPPGRAAGAAADRAHVVETERQQHRLLQPLVDLPRAVRLRLGDARLALVEQIERELDGVAHFTLGGGVDGIAGVEGGVQRGFESGKRH